MLLRMKLHLKKNQLLSRRRKKEDLVKVKRRLLQLKTRKLRNKRKPLKSLLLPNKRNKRKNKRNSKKEKELKKKRKKKLFKKLRNKLKDKNKRREVKKKQQQEWPFKRKVMILEMISLKIKVESRLISKLEKPSKDKIPSMIIPATALKKRTFQDIEEEDNPNKKMKRPRD